ncbi:MAG: sigma-54-dependent Fis family transcriptional regulator [Planctomycetes bacterium]|nr:sigma-54-dependent Fis family transcriptional regulator [Planctomycetota bacterium]CAG0991885.1 Regulatory protein AtoC [Planctomycetaceae bacterium]
MTDRPHILVVDDKESMRDMLSLAMSARKIDVTQAGDGLAALDACKRRRFDAIVSDLKMPRLDGMGLLKELRKQGDVPPFIFITAHGSVKDAVQAMGLGASDFIEKPFDLTEFEFKVERAIEEGRASRAKPGEVEVKQPELKSGEVLPGLIGNSPQLIEIADIVKRAARSTVPVLILGESGTGKELVARAVHALSPRADKPFVAVNAGALAAGVLESELFGHEKGAFTGAESQRKGRFEMANGGTLFLDELAEIPASTQVKLLRVLQDKHIERVGGSESIKVDVRLVCATNKDLRTLSKAGAFREDLYYRVNVVTVQLPSLRERPEDVPVLVQHFLKKENAKQAVPDNVMQLLKGHAWPGNVRELENAIRRMVALAPSGELRAQDLPAEVQSNSAQSAAASGLTGDLERIEKNAILAAMNESGWNQSRAARVLGVGRTALQYKMKKYGIQKPGT